MKPRGPAFRALAVAGAVGLCTTASSARDANRVHVFVLGRGTAKAACEGLDSSNANQTRVRFPRNPELSFRARLPGGIGQAPASDEAGNLLVVHGEPRLSKLDAKARTLWTERLPSEASCSPVLTSDGSILIVTRDAEALAFSASGKLSGRRSLPLSDPRRRTTAIPTSRGGILIASGSDVLELDQTLRIVLHTRAKGSVTALAESGAQRIAVSENGTVEVARESGELEVLGNLGGSAPEGAAVQGGKVFAVIDAHKFVALDLASGQAVTLALDLASMLTGPAVLLGTRGAAFVADNGFVSLRDRQGTETLRVAISAAGAGFDLARSLRGTRLIGDDDGALAAVQPGNDALLLAADGSAVRLDGTSCIDPFRPTPTTQGIVLACRSGQLFGVSGKVP